MKLQKTLFTFLLFFITSLSFSQGLKSIGFTVGGTRSNQKWNYETPDIKLKEKYINGFNASIFAEYLDNDYIRLITELQYNQKGTRENQIINQGAKYRLNYICFNNYLKIRSEGYDFTPYCILGPRVEYLFTSSHPKAMSLLHVSLLAGAGCEFMFWSPAVTFIEFNFNPDPTNAYKESSMEIKNKAFELRVGLKYVFGPAHNCPKAYNPAGVKAE